MTDTVIEHPYFLVSYDFVGEGIHVSIEIRQSLAENFHPKRRFRILIPCFNFSAVRDAIKELEVNLTAAVADKEKAFSPDMPEDTRLEDIFNHENEYIEHALEQIAEDLARLQS